MTGFLCTDYARVQLLERIELKFWSGYKLAFLPACLPTPANGAQERVNLHRDALCLQLNPFTTGYP